MAISKTMVSGSMTMLLLKLLSEKDMYGYEMISTLRQRSQNVFELKAGTLYPLLHTGPGLDVTVGRGTSVGHGAVVHGCTVGDGCLIGMHATILNGAVIGDGCLIAAGALVPENMQVPTGSLVIGVPGKVVRPVSAAQADAIKANEEEYLELARAHAEAK